MTHEFSGTTEQIFTRFVDYLKLCKKRKVLPYSFASIGPGADPGVQAVSPQETKPSSSGRLPLLSARPAVTFPAKERLCS